MEASRLIPGGGTNRVMTEAVGDGDSRGVEGLVMLVDTASRLAYRRSKRDREGDGRGIRTDRFDRSEEGVSDL